MILAERVKHLCYLKSLQYEEIFSVNKICFWPVIDDDDDMMTVD